MCSLEQKTCFCPTDSSPSEFARELESETLSVLVFKTNIATQEDLTTVGLYLDRQPHISEWSVDQEDCDKVLRIAGFEISTPKIIEALDNLGITCQELP